MKYDNVPSKWEMKQQLADDFPKKEGYVYPDDYPEHYSGGYDQSRAGPSRIPHQPYYETNNIPPMDERYGSYWRPPNEYRYEQYEQNNIQYPPNHYGKQRQQWRREWY